MSTKIYAKNYNISNFETTRNGQLKNSALFAIFQDIAEAHVSSLGYGNDVIMPRGLLWVVASQTAEIGRMPVAGEEIVVKTWMDDTRLTFFPRHYCVESATGEVLIEASAFWALMSSKSREIVNPADYDMVLKGADIAAKARIPKNPRSLEFTGSAHSTVIPEFIDNNGHMNNAKYFDIVDDALASEWDGASPVSINARYLSEALLGDKLEILWGSEGKKYFVLCRSERSEHFKLEIILP